MGPGCDAAPAVKDNELQRKKVIIERMWSSYLPEEIPLFMLYKVWNLILK